MKENGIRRFLETHASVSPVSFHMPGHKGSRIYKKYGYEKFTGDIADFDITEITGADNLFQTEGIIKETSEKYARLYDVKKSYLLINGTSAGLIAAVLASVPKGKKLIMARNCHKSVFNALTLGDIEPVYAYPDMIEEYGIAGAINPEEIRRLIDENTDAEAVILPSPNYYGICSNIKEIAEIVHEAGKILIVDQAHGAHLKFFSDSNKCEDDNKRYVMPLSAEECGADIVVNSIHKTLLSFTQSAVLNLNSDRVEQYELEDRLQAIQSTSPSYILMASLDINADILTEHGEELISQWRENIEGFYRRAEDIDGLTLMNVSGYMDRTKINLDMSSIGISGRELEYALLDRGIFAELVTGSIVMCMTGIGNTADDLERLLEALAEIASKSGASSEDDVKKHINGDEKGAKLWSMRRKLYGVPEKKKMVSIDMCEGLISAASIIPYPPGIPFICPGEKIGKDEIQYIKELREAGEKVIGISEKGEIAVGIDNELFLP